jgi:hypothetical protein
MISWEPQIKMVDDKLRRDEAERAVAYVVYIVN